jgi:hypothetical protein
MPMLPLTKDSSIYGEAAWRACTLKEAKRSTYDMLQPSPEGPSLKRMKLRENGVEFPLIMRHAEEEERGERRRTFHGYEHLDSAFGYSRGTAR